MIDSEDGSVLAWGDNSKGQLGNTTNTTRVEPPNQASMWNTCHEDLVNQDIVYLYTPIGGCPT